MDKQASERSPEFQQFLQQVEAALIKSSAEARRIAEQIGTKLVICENAGQQACGIKQTKSAAPVSNGRK